MNVHKFDVYHQFVEMLRYDGWIAAAYIARYERTSIQTNKIRVVVVEHSQIALDDHEGLIMSLGIHQSLHCGQRNLPMRIKLFLIFFFLENLRPMNIK